jgi:hypothetical protein
MEMLLSRRRGLSFTGNSKAPSLFVFCIARTSAQLGIHVSPDMLHREGKDLQLRLGWVPPPLDSEVAAAAITILLLHGSSTAAWHVLWRSVSTSSGPQVSSLRNCLSTVAFFRYTLTLM